MTEPRLVRTRWRRIARLLSEVRRRALWITAPRQTRIRWHDRRRPLAIGTVLQVHDFDDAVYLGRPGSRALPGESLIGDNLTGCRLVKVLEVSDDGTEAEVRPTSSRRIRKAARGQGENT